MKITIPSWLRTDPFACHVPDRTIFEPQRRITYRNGVPCLLDVCEQAYPLAHCDRLKLEHLNGVALLITPNQVITIYRDRNRRGRFILTDGRQKLAVCIPVKSEERLAAESLADFFDGEIIEGSDGYADGSQIAMPNGSELGNSNDQLPSTRRCFK